MRAFLALLLLLPALVHADDNEATCRTHLKHLAGAVGAYKLIHNDKPPGKLSDLYLDGFVDSYSDFVCPASGTSITSTGEIDAKSDYAFATGDIVVQEKAGHRFAAFADGSIKPVVAALDKRGPDPVTPTPPRSPSAATTDPESDFSLIPPGTVIPPQQPPPPPPPLGPRPAGYLGVDLNDEPNSGNGAYVVGAVPGGPAAAAGLRAGDLILALNGEPIQTTRQLGSIVAGMSPGQRVDLLVLRAGRNQKLTVVLGARPR